MYFFKPEVVIPTINLKIENVQNSGANPAPIPAAVCRMTDAKKTGFLPHRSDKSPKAIEPTRTPSMKMAWAVALQLRAEHTNSNSITADEPTIVWSKTYPLSQEVSEI